MKSLTWNQRVLLALRTLTGFVFGFTAFEEHSAFFAFFSMFFLVLAATDYFSFHKENRLLRELEENLERLRHETDRYHQ